MNALKPRAPFQVLVMSEESRLGREAIETAYALKQLVQAGVRVFFYLEDRERTLDSPTDKIMLSLTAFADELEREKARQRTYDAMQRKAKAGHVTGGRVFGYDNVEILAAGQRSHVERRVNDAEAAVVRRIFELSAAGEGLTRITKTLNEEHVPAPRPQQGRPVGWAGSSVRDVLLRPLYRGEIVWNQTRKRDTWGAIEPAGACSRGMGPDPGARAPDRLRGTVERGPGAVHGTSEQVRSDRAPPPGHRVPVSAVRVREVRNLRRQPLSHDAAARGQACPVLQLHRLLETRRAGLCEQHDRADGRPRRRSPGDVAR
jgi:DNA invertase Pin-like site-specific DNA recombinase